MGASTRFLRVRNQGSQNRSILDCVNMQANGQVLVVQSTTQYWETKHSQQSSGKGGNQKRRRAFVDKKDVEKDLMGELRGLVGAQSRMPRPARSKLVNWRTSQVEKSLQSVLAATGAAQSTQSNIAKPVPVLTAGIDKSSQAQQGDPPPLVLTGDWCVESSFEGC